MDFGFPSRFLRKLDIYQQIRSGQGLAKYKKLWPMERAFLKWGYEKHHQNLEVFVVYDDAKKEIAERCLNYDPKQVGHALGNLYFKGLVDVKIKLSEWYANDFRTINPKESGLEELDERRNDGREEARLRKDRRNVTYIRPSLSGLDVGEVVSEIENECFFVGFWGRLKYELSICTIWLAALLVLLRLIVGDSGNFIDPVNQRFAGESICLHVVTGVGVIMFFLVTKRLIVYTLSFFGCGVRSAKN